MYAMASQLNMTNNHLLWLGIVGLTDQFLHKKITEQRYYADYEHFKSQVLEHNMDDEAGVWFPGFAFKSIEPIEPRRKCNPNDRV